MKSFSSIRSETSHFFLHRSCSLVIIGALTASLVACAPEEKKAAPAELRKVTGDPIVYVADSQMSGTSGSLPASLFIGAKAQLWEARYYGFKQEILITDQPADGSPAQATQGFPNLLQLIRDGEGRALLSGETDDSSHWKLRFHVRSDGTYQLAEDLKFFEANETVQVLHYSSTPDDSAFSILVYVTSPQNKTLLALAFHRLDSGIVATKNSSSYEYLLDDYKVGWSNEKVTRFSMCRIEPPALKSLIRNALSNWTNHLEGRVELELEDEAQCPPFSDLNTHTIQVVDDWVEQNGPSGTMGIVWARFFLGKDSLADADMFIFKSELSEFWNAVAPGTDFNVFETYEKSWIQKDISWLVTHEFGHMLGLGHKQNGTPSVMSYDFDHWIGQLRTYDVEALQHLYPLKSSLQN
jgi:hypothetical protein